MYISYPDDLSTHVARPILPRILSMFTDCIIWNTCIILSGQAGAKDVSTNIDLTNIQMSIQIKIVVFCLQKALQTDHSEPPNPVSLHLSAQAKGCN